MLLPRLAHTGASVEHQALRSDRLPKKLAHHGFIMLRRLAGNTCRLPDNYLVGEGDNFQVEEKIFACGGFADIRKGTLAEKVVAVKTIRIAEDSDFPKIQKVSTIISAWLRFC